MDFQHSTIYTTYSFKDKNTGQLIQKLSVLNSVNPEERIVRTLQELKEKYCLPETDILIDKLSA